MSFVLRWNNVLLFDVALESAKISQWSSKERGRRRKVMQERKKSLLIPMCIYSGGHSGGAWGCPPYQGQWVLQEIWEAHLWRLILRKKVLSASAALNAVVQHFRINSIVRNCILYLSHYGHTLNNSSKNEAPFWVSRL